MENMLFLMIATVAVFLAAIIIHCLYSRFLGEGSGFSSGIRKLAYHGSLSLKIWIVLLPAVMLLGFNSDVSGWFNSFTSKIAPEKIILIFFGLIMIFSFFFVYLTFYYVLDRSVSSRMMMEIEKSPGKKLTYEQLKTLYGIDEKYIQNLDGMVQGGFAAVDQDGRFSCTLKGAFVARISHFLKSVLKLGSGG